jgi:IclR family transcriptional regulator, KDG regulon repressor
MDEPKTQGFYNKSLERALQILGSFTNEQRSATLTEIARTVGVPKSTSLRLCATLVEYGFLQFDEQAKEYAPGLKLFELGGLVLESFSVGRIAAPHMDRLQETLGQTSFVDIIRDGYLVHMDKREDSSSPIRFGLQVGRRRPPHYGASGFLLMAYLPEDEVERLLKRFPLVELTRKSITDEALFKERLRVIRSLGYAVDEGETVEVVTAVSAPIRNHAGKVVAALAVGYVSHSLSERESARVISETVNTAHMISQSMGFIG